MAQKYSRVLRAVTDQPWAILRSKLEQIAAVVQARAEGHALTKDEIQAQIGITAQRPTRQIIGTVGVIPVFGVLAQRMNMFVEISGGTSYQELLSQFRAMRDDPQVKAIVFEHDSPGGEVFGLEEIAEEIFAARDAKKLIAVVNPLSASASLWLAAACHEIIVTPSGMIGCIGAISKHVDYSKQNEMVGENPTYIVSAPYKAEGNEDEPLTDEAAADIQKMVDAYGDKFEKFVAKCRGVSQGEVKSNFGGGRMLLAKEAVKVGLADKIGTMDDTISRLVGRRSSVAARAEGDTPIVLAVEVAEAAGAPVAVPELGATAESSAADEPTAEEALARRNADADAELIAALR